MSDSSTDKHQPAGNDIRTDNSTGDTCQQASQ